MFHGKRVLIKGNRMNRPKVKQGLTQFNNRRPIRRKILVLLAVILMASAYGSPSGLHLNLCFGEDGHWDITVVPCASDQQTPVPGHTDVPTTGPQEKCVDFTTACEDKELCGPDFVLFSQNSSPRIFKAASPIEVPHVRPLLCVKSSSIPSSFAGISLAMPEYLSSVVLLI